MYLVNDRPDRPRFERATPGAAVFDAKGWIPGLSDEDILATFLEFKLSPEPAQETEHY